MKTTKIIEAVKAKNARSYWGKGVQTYAIEMLELVADWNPDLTLENCKKILLNGAKKKYVFMQINIQISQTIKK